MNINFKLFLNRLPFNITINLLFILFGLITIFHFLIIFQFIPYEMTWGGNLKTLEEMYVFEGISILINTIMMYVVFIKRTFIISNTTNKIINRIILAMAVIFLINTLGNLTTKNILKFAIATPMTLILSILCLRLSFE